MAKRHVALTRKMVEEAIYIDIEKRINDEIPALIGEFSDGRYKCRITDKHLFKLAYGRTAVCADINTYLNSLLDRSLTSGRKLVDFSEFELGHMKALLPHRVAEDLRKECELLKHAVENDQSLETGEENDGSDEEPLGLIGSVRNTDVKAVEGHIASGTNWDLDTALFLAAWNDNTRIMGLLINAGPDVDFVHEHIDSGTVKKSALMVAAEYNNVKAVKLLLKAGADPNLEGMDGDVTALDIGGDTVYDILIKAGAKGRQWVAARDGLLRQPVMVVLIWSACC